MRVTWNDIIQDFTPAAMLSDNFNPKSFKWILTVSKSGLHMYGSDNYTWRWQSEGHWGWSHQWNKRQIMYSLQSSSQASTLLPLADSQLACLSLRPHKDTADSNRLCFVCLHSPALQIILLVCLTPSSSSVLSTGTGDHGFPHLVWEIMVFQISQYPTACYYYHSLLLCLFPQTF